MQHLPTGTVTLLFTDIEGSTHLLQQLGGRYPDVLAEYRSLLRTVFHTYGGHEVDTQGDSFFVAFAHATDAVSAAVEMQRALAAHAWPNGVTVPTRIGLHTGEPQLSAEGYVGLDVHYAVRIMSAGHGGQVLLSQTTCDLVMHSLPEGVDLQDLGVYHLKGLQHPSHFFQLVIVGLPAVFPQLRTLDTHSHNLPVQPTPFVGREQVVANVQELLHREDVRLLTLIGPGGIGKTRLGLQVAADLASHFVDGIFFVNLAPISDPALVIPTIASTLDLKESAGQTLLETLTAYLRNKHLLLLLDNFEQVVSAAVQIADLLAACPKLKVIVTSRAVLHVRGEQEFAVPPLAIPDHTHLPDLVELSQYEAVALFLARAQAIKPEFQLTHANASAIAEICVRLDGLPLAIELAAARIKLLPPQALLARLDQRLELLTSGARDVPARQQTLRNTIKWSYNLLDAQEQRLFRCLSVFVGGCTLEAVEAVCADLDGADVVGSVLDGVGSLIDKSLLYQNEQEGEELRLLMLETIREYGMECLLARGEMEATQRAHTTYYLTLTELGEPQPAVWLEQLEREHDNLRAAMHWLVKRGETESALRLGVALLWFWIVHAHLSEGRNFLKQALLGIGSERVDASVRAAALWAAALLAQVQSDLDQAEALYRKSLALFRELENTPGIATSLHRLGVVACLRGNYVDAHSLAEEALVLWRELGITLSIAAGLLTLAYIAFFQGEYDRAHTLAEESLAFFREGGTGRGTAESLAVLARVAAAQGDDATARACYDESLILYKELGDKEGIVVNLEGLAEVAAAQGEPARAAQFWGTAKALREAIGVPLPPNERSTYERKVTAVRTQLGDQSFAAAWAEGRAMTPEQALAVQTTGMKPTSEELSSTPPTKSTPTYPDGLTTREVEVLQLVAQGMTNEQVAEQLVISPRTVNTHLTSIYGKIGVSSRSAATRYAMEHKLL